MVRISPADIGRRVTVRHLTHAGAGEPSRTDVVGFLRSWDGGELEIERRDGTRARVREADVVAARVVEPPRGRRPPN